MVESPLQSELRRRMVAHGYNQKSLARTAGLNETAVRDILKGRSRNPRIDTLEALSRVLACSVLDLRGLRERATTHNKTDRIDVIGAVEANVLRPSVVRATDEWYQIDTPKDPRYFNRPRFALEIRGNAANRFYKPGDLVICVNPEELDRKLTVADRLVIQVKRSDRKFEYVIGELQMDDEGQAWFWVGSGNGGHMSKSDKSELEVIAVVVGSLKQE